MFLQPDWFEVTKAGVGTNRFSYSFNDPVNKFDPGGNETKEEREKKKKEEEDRHKQRDERHIDNARISARLGAEMVDDGYGWDDPLGQQHFGNAWREYGMVGNSAFGEFWDVVGQTTLDAALMGAPAGIAITQTAREQLEWGSRFLEWSDSGKSFCEGCRSGSCSKLGSNTARNDSNWKHIRCSGEDKESTYWKVDCPNEVWDWASRRFASGATSATVVMGSIVRPTSTWIRRDANTSAEWNFMD